LAKYDRSPTTSIAPALFRAKLSAEYADHRRSSSADTPNQASVRRATRSYLSGSGAAPYPDVAELFHKASPADIQKQTPSLGWQQIQRRQTGQHSLWCLIGLLTRGDRALGGRAADRVPALGDLSR
jgi:hypothetical protein